MTSASGSSSRARPRCTSQHGLAGVGPLSLIACPYHPEETVVQLVADTDKNRGKKFYRCMKNAWTPRACKFFKWEKEYLGYLIDNGFLEEPEIDVTGDVGGTIAELTGAIGELKGEVSVLKREVGKKAAFGAGEMINVLVVLYVVVVIAFVILALFK